MSLFRRFGDRAEPPWDSTRRQVRLEEKSQAGRAVNAAVISPPRAVHVTWCLINAATTDSMLNSGRTTCTHADVP